MIRADWVGTEAQKAKGVREGDPGRLKLKRMGGSRSWGVT